MILVPLLLAQMAAHTARSLVTDPESVKQVARESGVYAKVEQQLVANLTAGADRQGARLPLIQAEIRQLVRQVLPPTRVEAMGDRVADGMHAWLMGQRRRPDIVLDLSDVRREFPEAVRQMLYEKVAALPVCTPAQALQLLNSYGGGMPPCKSPDERINRSMVDRAVAEARVEEMIPTRYDLAAQFEALYGPWFWQEAEVSVAGARVVLGLIPWGWGVIAILLLLLALLNLDQWWTPFGWIAAPLLIGGGLITLGALVAVAMVPRLGPGDWSSAIAFSLLHSAGIALRQTGMLVALAGLGCLVLAVAGRLISPPPDRRHP